jgi:hypothetical protein
MPWDKAQMRRKGARQPAVAAKVANQRRRRCLAKGGTEKACDVSAIRIGLHASNQRRRRRT